MPSPLDNAPSGFEELLRVLAGRRFVVVTGAGCSTESGIPDYRGNGQPPSRNPIQHDAFIRKPEVRRRYWARATVGWSRFSRARPNAAHHALAALEASGHLTGIITQNVDRLHREAGSVRVVEIHGALADVRCLGCGTHEPRGSLHQRLLLANPTWLDRIAELAPDGDSELPAADVAAFETVGCLACPEGVLMPDVVFFGGTVAAEKVAAAWQLVSEAEGLLVVGSSLAVYSGWRFVRGAAERGLPVAIVNLGQTRADAISHIRVAARAGDVLPRLAVELGCVPVS